MCAAVNPVVRSMVRDVCRGAYEEDVLVYGDSAQQAIVATVMEETGNFTCPDGIYI